MIRSLRVFWMIALYVQTVPAKQFDSYSVNRRRNVPSTLLSSASLEYDDMNDLLAPPIAYSKRSPQSTTKQSPRFDWQMVSDSIVKSVVAVLFARCLYIFLTGLKQRLFVTKREKEEQNNNNNTTTTPKSTTTTTEAATTDSSSSSSSSSVPPLSSTAEWKDIIERVNYLQATLREYHELWTRRWEEQNRTSIDAWTNLQQASPEQQQVQRINNNNPKIQGLEGAQVSEETTVETVTTVESESRPADDFED